MLVNFLILSVLIILFLVCIYALMVVSAVNDRMLEKYYMEHMEHMGDVYGNRDKESKGAQISTNDV